MIIIKVSEVDHRINSISFSGHAYSDEPGKDLICAAISSIAFGTLNALEEMRQGQELRVEDNFISARITQGDIVTDTILRTAYIQCLTVQQSNEKFVRIEKEKIK